MVAWGTKGMKKVRQEPSTDAPGPLSPALSPNHSPIKLFPSNAALKRRMMIFCCDENQVMIPI